MVQAIRTAMESVYGNSQLNSVGVRVNRREGSDSDPYKVTLSEEAQALAEESKNSEETNDTSTIDEAIEKIKEQIKAVKNQLAHLDTPETQDEIQQQKMLNEMLASLNAKLIDLMVQKLEAQA